MKKILMGVVLAIALIALTAAATRINLTTQSIVGGTNYGVLYQSASGIPATITGASGTVLTSTGTGSVPIYTPITGPTLSANQTFTGVNTFSSASSTFAGNAATATTATAANTANTAITATMATTATTAITAITADTATTATTTTNLLGGTVQGTQLGFLTGAGVGGTVSTPYGTNATLNKMSGQITVQAYNYSAGNLYYTNVYDSNVTANDVVVVSWAPGSVSNAVLWTNVNTGVFTINFYVLANSVTGQPNYINFVVIKNSVN
jgi:hypothetical protein